MGTLDVGLFGSKTIGKPGSLEDLFRMLNTIGYETKRLMVGSWVDGIHKDWPIFNEQVLEELDIAYEKEQIRFEITETIIQYPELMDLHGFVEITWVETPPKRSKLPYKYLKYSTHGTPIFTQKKYSSEDHCENLLHIVRLLYKAYKPRYGWVERGLMSGYTTRDAIKNLEIPHIYWANIFGPEYVEKYGKEYFQNAPGWLCEFLDDGGCLYVLSPDINRNKKGIKALEEEVKAYFDIENVRKKKRKKKATKKVCKERRLP